VTTPLTIKSMIAPSAAFTVAAGLHVMVAVTLLWMPKVEIIPPVAVGGFEVVDLSAFGVTVQPEPEPIEETQTEEAKVEPEPEPELEPEPEPTPEPEVIKKADPAPLPKAVEKPKPKPKSVKKPKPIQKTEAKPQPKPKRQVDPSVGSQNAFVPPKSNAAYLKNPKPAYPTMALKRGMQGLVLLSVEVSPKGQPLAVLIKQSSGFVLLDKAALKAVHAWRFAPATRGGIPVAARVDIPIRFSLNDI